MAIMQCIRCPKSFHTKCQTKDRSIKVTKKLVVCGDHRRKPLLFNGGGIDEEEE